MAMTTNAYAKDKISLAELRSNPEGVIASATNAPVGIVTENGTSAYLVPAAVFEALLDALEDIDLAEIVEERRRDPTVKVSLDDL
jgi:antitoxin StbD